MNYLFADWLARNSASSIWNSLRVRETQLGRPINHSRNRDHLELVHLELLHLELSHLEHPSITVEIVIFF